MEKQKSKLGRLGWKPIYSKWQESLENTAKETTLLRRRYGEYWDKKDWRDLYPRRDTDWYEPLPIPTRGPPPRPWNPSDLNEDKLKSLETRLARLETMLTLILQKLAELEREVNPSVRPRTRTPQEIELLAH